MRVSQPLSGSLVVNRFVPRAAHVVVVRVPLPAVRAWASTTSSIRLCHRLPSNHSFKPSPLRGLGARIPTAPATRAGLTQALGIDDSPQCDRHLLRHTFGCTRLLPFTFFPSFHVLRKEAAATTSPRLFPQCGYPPRHCNASSRLASRPICCSTGTWWDWLSWPAALHCLRRCMLVAARPRKVPRRSCLSKASAQCLTIRSSRARFAASAEQRNIVTLPWPRSGPA